MLPPGPALEDAGPNWEQFQSAQIPSQLTPMYVLDKMRVDYTLAQGTLRCGTQLGAISVGPGSQSTWTKVCTCMYLTSREYITL